MNSSSVVAHFLNNTLNSVESNLLFGVEDRVLVGVSGGVDSIVLAEALVRLGYTIGIAHINYQLRGDDSDQDEELVRNFAANLEVPFYCQKVVATKEQSISGLSMQEYARNIRYTFYTELATAHHYTKICTAHHLDDQIETVLYRLAKGAGWKGLLGIPIKNGLITRPLLSVSKSAILAFAEACGLPWRQDTSNLVDKYSRNHIRLNIIPAIQKLNPSFEKTFRHDHAIRLDSYHFYMHSIGLFWKDKVLKKDRMLQIHCEQLLEQTGAQSLLYEILALFGFNHFQVSDVFGGLMKGTSGGLYANDFYEILMYRKKLYIRPINSKSALLYTLPSQYEEGASYITWNGTITHQLNPAFKRYFSIPIPAQSDPLELRTWKKGDYFTPDGMGGNRKKLSDYFNDIGINRFERDQLLMLCQASRVLWVPGYRYGKEIELSDEPAGYHLSFNLNATREEFIDVFELSNSENLDLSHVFR